MLHYLAGRRERNEPQALIELYTRKNIAIDRNYDLLDHLFDKVIDCGDEPFSYASFVKLRNAPPRYDVIDFQYLLAAEDARAFEKLSKKSLSTPMECVGRDLALHGGETTEDSRKSCAEKATQEQALCRIVDEVVCVSKPEARTVVFVAYFGSPTNIEALDRRRRELAAHDGDLSYPDGSAYWALKRRNPKPTGSAYVKRWSGSAGNVRNQNLSERRRKCARSCLFRLFRWRPA